MRPISEAPLLIVAQWKMLSGALPGGLPHLTYTMCQRLNKPLHRTPCSYYYNNSTSHPPTSPPNVHHPPTYFPT